MKNGMDRINELIEEYDFPVNVLNDINKRLIDWVAAGGKATDGYVWQQVRCLENLVRLGLVERKALIL